MSTKQEQDDRLFLGIDVGGTNVKAGVVRGDGTVVSHAAVPTEAVKGPDHGVSRMAGAARLAMQTANVGPDAITAVGLATPGTMDIPAGMLLNPPNLPGWDDYPVRDRVAEQIGLPTILQNDANAAAYGEYWAGSAREADSLVFYTLGTGLGGGIIVNDTIIQGEHSHGSELGHVIIEMNNGRRCATGQFGTLEAYCSATALLQQFEAAMLAGRSTSVAAMLQEDRKLTPLLISQAAEDGDELSQQLILDMATCLGVGITTVSHVIDPSMVLLGGAMTFGRDETSTGRAFIGRVRDVFRQRAFPAVAEAVTIGWASLGGAAGFIGAAGCARLSLRQRSV